MSKIIGQLATIESATGKTVTDDTGKTMGVLILTTADGPLDLNLSDFDAIYKGFVKCWPTIKPLKEKVIAAQRDEVAAEKAKIKEQAQADKDAAKAKAKAEREKKLADAKAKGADKAKNSLLKEQAKLLKSAGVADAEAAQAKLDEKGTDGKPVLKPKAIKQMKAIIALQTKIDKA